MQTQILPEVPRVTHESNPVKMPSIVSPLPQRVDEADEASAAEYHTSSDSDDQNEVVAAKTPAANSEKAALSSKRGSKSGT